MQTTPQRDPRKDKKKKPVSRYEIEPQMGSKAERPEEKENRPDLEQMETEKGAVSAIDQAYAGEVSRFFNEKRRIADVTDAEDTELFDNDAFLAQEQRSLEKLANPETAKLMRAKDVAFALGDLAGTMGARNPEDPGNRTGDAAADAATERGHGDARKIFMDTAAKVYPNVEVDSGDLSNEFKLTAERLRFEADASWIPDLAPEAIKRLEADPEALEKRVDDAIGKTGDLLQTRAKMSFDVQDPKKRVQQESHLAAGAEMFYKLQLIRDELRAKRYGRKDISAEERKKVDEMRSAFSEGGEKTTEGAGKEAPKGAELAEALKDSTGAEAIRGVWKNEGKFSGRMDALGERIARMTELKTGDDDHRIGPDAALRLSIRQAYADLLPAEIEALDRAADAERERERADLEKKGMKPPEKGAASGERLFVELMTRFIKEKGG